MKTKFSILAAVFLMVAMGVSGQINTNDGRSASSNASLIIGDHTLIPVQPVGLFVTDEDIPARDVVVADDQIVTGSLGVGIDCADGEVFGFVTILMKENNTQLKFDDTSLTAGFPANDWALIANDAASGGANYLAIQDATAGVIPFKVMAGAPVNALIVSASGKVGFGTANPSQRLHAKYGDSPGLRLEQDSTMGWTAQTWDLAGNEANFFIRDVTNGSSLPFRIKPGAPSNSLYVASNGNIGLGIMDPVEKLEVEGSMKLAAILVAPATPAEGTIYMDGNDHTLKYFANTIWNTVTPDTDQQDLAAATLTGSMLQIYIENGASVSVDLSPLLADLEARVAALEALAGLKESSTEKSKMSQNSPNPFINETSIPYFIPADVETASLVIYNVKGETIKEIQLNARGNGTVVIGKTDLGAGSYFYALVLDGTRTESKIMIKVE